MHKAEYLPFDGDFGSGIHHDHNESRNGERKKKDENHFDYHPHRDFHLRNG